MLNIILKTKLFVEAAGSSQHVSILLTDNKVFANWKGLYKSYHVQTLWNVGQNLDICGNVNNIAVFVESKNRFGSQFCIICLAFNKLFKFQIVKLFQLFRNQTVNAFSLEQDGWKSKNFGNSQVTIRNGAESIFTVDYNNSGWIFWLDGFI